VGDGAGGDGGRVPRRGGRGARDPARRALGPGAQAGGAQRACYHDATVLDWNILAADKPQIHKRGYLVSTLAQKELKVGDPAPDFTVKSIGLKEISLRDYRGKNVVLLFYPLDWTPG
jgi:AhpC/TSA family protein